MDIGTQSYLTVMKLCSNAESKITHGISIRRTTDVSLCCRPHEPKNEGESSLNAAIATTCAPPTDMSEDGMNAEKVWGLGYGSCTAFPWMDCMRNNMKRFVDQLKALKWNDFKYFNSAGNIRFRCGPKTEEECSDDEQQCEDVVRTGYPCTAWGQKWIDHLRIYQTEGASISREATCNAIENEKICEENEKRCIYNEGVCAAKPAHTSPTDFEAIWLMLDSMKARFEPSMPGRNNTYYNILNGNYDSPLPTVAGSESGEAYLKNKIAEGFNALNEKHQTDLDGIKGFLGHWGIDFSTGTPALVQTSTTSVRPSSAQIQQLVSAGTEIASNVAQSGDQDGASAVRNAVAKMATAARLLQVTLACHIGRLLSICRLLSCVLILYCRKPWHVPTQTNA